MVGGAAADDIDAVKAFDLLIGEFNVVQLDLVILSNSGGEGLAQGVGLLLDFLHHEVLVAALFCGVDVPVHMLEFLEDGVSVLIEESDAVRLDDSEFTVVHLVHFPGVVQDSGNVRGNVVALRADGHNEGAGAFDSDECVRVIGVENTEGVGALKHFYSFQNGLKEVAVVVFVQQHGDNFCVGVTVENIAFFLEVRLQGGKILNDAIVDHREAPGCTVVRMGVLVTGLAVGCPAGVANADISLRSMGLGDLLPEAGDLALGLHNVDLPILEDGNSCRVITPVLELFEERGDVGCSVIADDSAHRLILPNTIEKMKITYHSTKIFIMPFMV